MVPSLINPLLLITFYSAFRSFILPLPILYLTLALMTYVFGVIGMLIVSTIYHGLVLLVGGRKWIKTFAAVVYSSTPSLLLSWVPIIGFLAYVWSLILLVIGLAKIHKISYWRSAVAVILLPVILLFGLIFTAGILLMRLLV